MKSDTFYFSHDYNTRTDDKIRQLVRKHGLQGYGIFWAIIEDLYNNANALRTDYECIAYDLRVDEEVIKSIVNDFELFVIEDGFFGSLSVERRLDEKNKKSEKCRQSSFKRWHKNPNALQSDINNNPNELPSESDANAIYKRKDIKDIKDIKNIKNIKEIKKK